MTLFKLNGCLSRYNSMQIIPHGGESAVQFHFVTVLFNYGSFDPFVAVDLGLTSQKRGRSPAMLRRERSILDQVQVRSILRLILPEMVARNQIKPELQERTSSLSTSPPRQRRQLMKLYPTT